MQKQFNETKRFRLDSMPSAQCHIEITMDGERINSISLISYETFVVGIQILDRSKMPETNPYYAMAVAQPGNGSYSYNCCDWTYSPTTARRINRFSREFFGENKYYQIKHIAEKDKPLYIYQDEGQNIIARAKWYLENGKKYYFKY